MLCARPHAAEAVRQRPDFFEANILYGTILYIGSEDREAISVLTRAHELKPEDRGICRLLAEELTLSDQRYANRGDWRPSIDLLEKAAALQLDSREISFKLDQARQRLGNNR